jgi:hypothetical protein
LPGPPIAAPWGLAGPGAPWGAPSGICRHCTEGRRCSHTPARRLVDAAMTRRRSGSRMGGAGPRSCMVKRPGAQAAVAWDSACGYSCSAFAAGASPSASTHPSHPPLVRHPSSDTDMQTTQHSAGAQSLYAPPPPHTQTPTHAPRPHTLSTQQVHLAGVVFQGCGGHCGHHGHPWARPKPQGAQAGDPHAACCSAGLGQVTRAGRGQPQPRGAGGRGTEGGSPRRGPGP